jgi:hypothetical protein
VPENESNDDYDKIFGSGGEAIGGGGEEEGFLFDPSEAGPGRVRPGHYRAKVLEPPVKQISQNGNPMMKTTFSITEGDFAGALQWKRFMLAGRGGTWTKEFLEAIGMPEEAAGTKPIQPKLLEGRHCIIGVRVQKNNEDFDEIYECKPHPKGVWGGDTTGDEPFLD